MHEPLSKWRHYEEALIICSKLSLVCELMGSKGRREVNEKSAQTELINPLKVLHEKIERE